MLDMQMEIDILKETINVLKRPRHRSDSILQSGEGSDNRCPENKYSLPDLLKTKPCKK